MSQIDPFTFNGEAFAGREGLAMGSPLIAVAACLFLKELEEDQFSKIMGPDTKWYRYVDDVLIVVPKELDLNEKLRAFIHFFEEHSFYPGGRNG